MKWRNRVSIDHAITSSISAVTGGNSNHALFREFNPQEVATLTYILCALELDVPRFLSANRDRKNETLCASAVSDYDYCVSVCKVLGISV